MKSSCESLHELTSFVADVVYLEVDEIVDFSHDIKEHAMKPLRVLLVHELITSLGLNKFMRILQSPPPLPYSLMNTHEADYLQQLSNASESPFQRVFSSDCPPVRGILSYAQAIAGASVAGAAMLNAKLCKIAINWAGGMHHARAGECSGFCYINDIVLAIAELLKSYERVMYIDLDVHHGDGVEESLYTTDRVFKLSLHKCGVNFFPGTGKQCDIGEGAGEYCTMNLEVPDGIGDGEYTALFTHALSSILPRFEPDAIVLQCGADSLAHDTLGVLNLSSIGHATCVRLVKDAGLPLLVVGGGGYTMRSVVRLWVYETSILCDAPLSPWTQLGTYLKHSDTIVSATLSHGLFHESDILLVKAEPRSAVVIANAQNAVVNLREFIDEFVQNIPPKATYGSLLFFTNP